ncbi:MAG: hypothetical protein ACPLXP_01710 [Microgenomates group bacterium]
MVSPEILTPPHIESRGSGGEPMVRWQEINTLLRWLEKRGLLNPINPKQDPEGWGTLKRWGRLEETSVEEVNRFFRERLTPEGKELLQRVAEERGLDLEENPSHFLEALNVVLPEREISPESGVIYPPVKPGVLVSEEKKPSPIPWVGQVLGKVHAVRAVSDDEETRQMIVDGVRERMELVLAILRSESDEARSQALQRQIRAIEESLERLLGTRVNWLQLLQEGLKAYYEEENVPEDQRWPITSARGMEIALEKVYLPLAVAVSDVQTRAHEIVDGNVARTIERQKAALELEREENRRALDLARQQTRLKVEGLRIEVEGELAERYSEVAPALKRAQEGERDLRAVKTATGAVVVREVLRVLSGFPPAVVGGFAKGIVEETKEHPWVAGAGVVGAVGGLIAVLGYGLPVETGLWIFFVSIAGGAFVTGLREGKKEEKKGGRESVSR